MSEEPKIPEVDNSPGESGDDGVDYYNPFLLFVVVFLPCISWFPYTYVIQVTSCQPVMSTIHPFCFLLVLLLEFAHIWLDLTLFRSAETTL